MSESNVNNDLPASHGPVISQWIVSLAVSIISCAILFVLMAFYITDQHISLTTTSMRIDLLNERQDRLRHDLEEVRRLVMPPHPMERHQGKAPRLEMDGVVNPGDMLPPSPFQNLDAPAAEPSEKQTEQQAQPQPAPETHPASPEQATPPAAEPTPNSSETDKPASP